MRHGGITQATEMSYKPPWASPGELLSCWAAGEDVCPSCGHLLCRSCPFPTCCSTPHPYWPNWWRIKKAFRTKDKPLACPDLNKICFLFLRSTAAIVLIVAMRVVCCLSGLQNHLGCAMSCGRRLISLQDINQSIHQFTGKSYEHFAGYCRAVTGLDQHPCD